MISCCRFARRGRAGGIQSDAGELCFILEVFVAETTLSRQRTIQLGQNSGGGLGKPHVFRRSNPWHHWCFGGRVRFITYSKFSFLRAPSTTLVLIIWMMRFSA